MKWYHQALIVLFVVCLAGGLTWSASHYHGLYKDEQTRADKAESLAQLRLDTINDMQVRQRDVAALDAKYTKDLADAQSKNDALRRKLDDGGRVLVKGKCPSVPKTTTSSSLDDGGSIELSATAGRNVFDIRTGIARDSYEPVHKFV